MSHIDHVSGASPLQQILNRPIQKELPVDRPATLRATDRLELSGMSHLMKALKANPDIRADKVSQIKAQIEAGTYEDDKKLDAAIDKLLDDLK